MPFIDCIYGTCQILFKSANLKLIKVENHANENPLKNSEKIAYVGQRLMYPIIKK